LRAEHTGTLGPGGAHLRRISPIFGRDDTAFSAHDVLFSETTMTTAAVCRVIGGTLVLLISAALAFGGIQLWRGGPKAWPDVIANETTVRRTSGGMMVLAALVLVAGVAALGNVPWGGYAAAVATIVVVVAAFPANYALFGDIRPLHTGTNIVVAAIILALLWIGHDGQTR
jgi:hypothetical protein